MPQTEYTEDDTFVALKRIPFREMRNIAVKYRIACIMGLPVEYTSFDQVFKLHGWTRKEYDACLESLNKGL